MNGPRLRIEQEGTLVALKLRFADEAAAIAFYRTCAANARDGVVVFEVQVAPAAPVGRAVKR